MCDKIQRFEMIAYKSNESRNTRIGNYLLPLQDSVRGVKPAENDAVLLAQLLYSLLAPVSQKKRAIHHLSALWSRGKCSLSQFRVFSQEYLSQQTAQRTFKTPSSIRIVIQRYKFKRECKSGRKRLLRGTQERFRNYLYQ